MHFNKYLDTINTVQHVCVKFMFYVYMVTVFRIKYNKDNNNQTITRSID